MAETANSSGSLEEEYRRMTFKRNRLSSFEQSILLRSFQPNKTIALLRNVEQLKSFKFFKF